ncbi:MAG: hypothetical protein ABI047_05945 [Jatrophihabitantaceae bacterium]
MQFSLFGAEAADPLVEDLDGVLLAGGDWVRTDGDSAARLSVLVAEDWRAQALQSEFFSRGLASDTAEAPGELIAVRTEITTLLGPHALRWTKGAHLRPPTDLALNASGLRLWAIAAGRAEEAGFLLRMADPDGTLHRAAGAQLARLGVAAIEVGSRVGTGWRVTSVKRLRRLAELIGAAPAGCGRDWPRG